MSPTFLFYYAVVLDPCNPKGVSSHRLSKFISVIFLIAHSRPFNTAFSFATDEIRTLIGYHTLEIGLTRTIVLHFRDSTESTTNIFIAGFNTTGFF